MTDPKTYNIILKETAKLTADVVQLTFDKPEGFNFKPGQFVQMRFDGEERPVYRSYSISCSSDSDYLQFCIKKVQNGIGTSSLFSMNTGDTICVSEPKGHFVDIRSSNKIYIATGVGLAPLISMIESQRISDTSKLYLVFGVRYEADLFWLERLENIKKTNSNFDYVVTVSRPSESWQGIRGRVVEHLPIDPTADYFVCGGLEMVKDVRLKLIQSNMNTKSIHMEIF